MGGARRGGRPQIDSLGQGQGALLARAGVGAAGTEPDQVSASLLLYLPQGRDQCGRPAVQGLGRLVSLYCCRHVLSVLLR